MSQDNRLMPLGGIDRSIDRPLSEFTAAKPYGTSGLEPTTFRDYLFVVLKRKWLILSLVLVVTSLVTIQAFRAPSIYAGEATIELFRTETANYRSNLNSGEPLLWIALRREPSGRAYKLLAVTADPAEGEAFISAPSNRS